MPSTFVKRVTNVSYSNQQADSSQPADDQQPAVLMQSQPGSSRWPALVLLALLVLVIIWRDPRYFTQPRFWAEEGTLHFAFSYSHPWYQALFQPQVGYLNFWPNLATQLATLPPLEAAPLVTTLLALLAQLLPAVLILFSRSDLWAGWPRKLAGLAVLLFSALSTEVWLNTINSYSYLALAAFLILLEPAPVTPARRWAYLAVLVVAGLTNTVACFLIPFFGLRALHEKDRERWLQAAVLSACAVLQLWLIFSQPSEAGFEQRFHLIGLSTLGATLWTQSLGLFAAGFPQAREWARALFSLTSQDLAAFQTWGRALLIVSAGLLLLLSANLTWKLRLVFLGSYGILLVLMMAFSIISDKYTLIDTGLHQRIFFAPNVILGWMLLAGIQPRRGKGRRAAGANLVSAFCALLLGASLLWGMINFRDMSILVREWPSWPAEVQAWRADPGHALRIQPEGWVVRLAR